MVIDGYTGVLWNNLREELDNELKSQGITTDWINVSDFMLPEEQIKDLKKPFLGGDDPVFGTRYTGKLADFFAIEDLQNLTPSTDVDLCILYGCGSALAGWNVPLIYVDLPKNELQFRSRAESITNLGISTAYDPKVMYKQFYFVDWIVLNKHKAELVDQVDYR